jgi:predicted HD phosphohydrolase
MSEAETAVETAASEPRATYRTIAESRPEDYVIQNLYQKGLHDGVTDLYLSFLRSLESPHLGFPVDRLEHSLQTATRAFRDGCDEEYVFTALFHDVGEAVAPANHPEAGGALLRPYVSDENYWLVRNHGVFQGYYYYHFIGRDRHLREHWRGHPNFEKTALFCEKYDQTSFDRDYDSMPLEAFEPMVRRILSQPPRFRFE